MTKIESILLNGLQKALVALYEFEGKIEPSAVSKTRKDFEGDRTIVVFPYLRFSKKKPEETGIEIGEWLKENVIEIETFNVVKGFLNVVIKDSYWQEVLRNVLSDDNYGQLPDRGERVVVEYSSPNTNKPLHLGHVRNNVLGYAISGILAANGYDVVKCNLINDRGIHICKSMLAWQKWGDGETPASTGIKGDHLVGKYYVLFDQNYKQELKDLISKGLTEEEAKTQSQLMQEARSMLQDWEAGNKPVVDLWTKMNNWVYDGFNITYENLGVAFDKYYYESDTYLLGKKIIDEGLEQNVFFKKEDGSVWIDLTDDGLDEKLLLRSDGTSVYISQDVGTAQLKYDEYKFSKSIYVVGNEQDYHFKVLKLILKKLGREHSEGLYHFSYGMVDLPSGKMKSREGTVVDADDLINEMVNSAKEQTKERGKIDEFTKEEAEKLYNVIGLGALKFYLLRVDPKKRILFDPAESIELQGYTGPFVQYAYARIQSLIRRFNSMNVSVDLAFEELTELERDLIIQIYDFPQVIGEAGEQLNPSSLIDYTYNLAKSFNRYYGETVIFSEDEKITKFRITLSEQIAKVIKKSFAIMGLGVPDKM